MNEDLYQQMIYLHGIKNLTLVEIIDLGLPSGLLWSLKYRIDEEGTPLYLTYEEAAALDIPTEEQFFELVNCCKWEHIMGYVDRGGYSYKQTVGKYCEGDNGEYIKFDNVIWKICDYRCFFFMFATSVALSGEIGYN